MLASNFLLAPNHHGDATTAVRVDAAAGLLLTGTAQGFLYAWLIDDLLDRHGPPEADLPAQLPLADGAELETREAHFDSRRDVLLFEHPRRTLCGPLREGIRDIIVDPESGTYAVQGDRSALCWTSYHDEQPQLVPLRQQMLLQDTDDETPQVLAQPPPPPSLADGAAVSASEGDLMEQKLSDSETEEDAVSDSSPGEEDELFSEDQRRQRQQDRRVRRQSRRAGCSREHDLVLCQRTQVLYPGHGSVVYLFAPRDSLHVYAADVAQWQHHTIPCRLPPRFGKESLAVAIDTELRVLLQSRHMRTEVTYVHLWDMRRRTFTHRLSMGSAHRNYWGFQTCDAVLAHVCCQNKVKIWELAPSVAGRTRSCRLRWKLDGHRSGHVLAILLEQQGQVVISFGSDRVIKFWHQGHCVRSISGIAGVFQLGYPVFLRRHKDWLLYTADDGLYCLFVGPEIPPTSGEASTHQDSKPPPPEQQPDL